MIYNLPDKVNDSDFNELEEQIDDWAAEEAAYWADVQRENMIDNMPRFYKGERL